MRGDHLIYKPAPSIMDRECNAFQDQMQSPFFSRLPAEVRQLVYTAVFTGRADDGAGAQLLHIVSLRDGAYYSTVNWICRKPKTCGSSPTDHLCHWNQTWLDNLPMLYDDAEGSRPLTGILELLTTCRKM